MKDQHKTSQPDWLRQFLVEAHERQLCTKIGCTTCGCMEFRNSFVSAIESSLGRACLLPFDVQAFRFVTESLSSLSRDELTSPSSHSAIRLIIYDFWRMGGDGFLNAIARGSYAGGIVAAMQEHEKARERQHAAHIDELERKRVEKEIAKQERMEERRLKKMERDKQWFKDHPNK